MSLRPLLFSAALLGPTTADPTRCSLNGEYVDGACACDAGWRGQRCSELDLAPVDQGAAIGLQDAATPTWGGTAIFEGGVWHLVVGSRAEALPDPDLEDYPCDSRVVIARSKTAGRGGAAGPYEILRELVPRSSWEPSLAREPGTGALLMMFFGNVSGAPAPGSEACARRDGYNLTNTNTYVSYSASGSVLGPWTAPQIARGMENEPREGKDPYGWQCASGNPSPAWHPNGTLFAAMRQDPCWKGFTTREHIGLWTADAWDGEWRPVRTDGGGPVFGWGGGSERDCTDANGCPDHEDPHLWWDERGAHLLTHYQNNHLIHKTRGAYGWSLDGLHWTLETLPLDSNSSAWEMSLRYADGGARTLARRQRVSLIRDPDSQRPTHVVNGADFDNADGTHWGTGFTLIQPLRQTPESADVHV